MVPPRTNPCESRTETFRSGVVLLPPADLVREITAARAVLVVRMLARTGVAIVNVIALMAKVLTDKTVVELLVETGVAGIETPTEILTETRRVKERRNETDMETGIARTKNVIVSAKGTGIEETERRIEIATENGTVAIGIAETIGNGRMALAVQAQLLRHLMARRGPKLLAIELEVLSTVKIL